MSGKIMPLEILSSIKGATSSEAVDQLFNVIKQAVPGKNEDQLSEMDSQNLVTVEGLRNDKVEGSTELEKEIIKKNFPKEKNGFLVVPKVIED